MLRSLRGGPHGYNFFMTKIARSSLMSNFGPMGVVVSIAMAIMMQGASLVIAGAVADGC